MWPKLSPLYVIGLCFDHLAEWETRNQMLEAKKLMVTGISKKPPERKVGWMRLIFDRPVLSSTSGADADK